MELPQLLQQTATAIRESVVPKSFHPGKFSMWLKFVKLAHAPEGTPTEETVGGPYKLVFTAGSVAELVEQVAENMVLTVYGAELPVTDDLPNLIVKLIDTKATVAVPGAPPLDQVGQIYLKATVYPFEDSLWERLFGRKQDENA